MSRIFSKFLFLFCFFILSVFSVSAQEKIYPPIAAYGVDGHLRVYQTGKEPQDIPEALPNSGKGFPLDLAWSPNGIQLAYRSIRGEYSGLNVLNAKDDSVTHIQEFPFYDLPFTFTMDSQHLLFGADGGGDGPAGPWYLTIDKADPKTGKVIDGVLCCANPSSGYAANFDFISPAERILAEEVGWYPPVFGNRFLEDTPFGVLHSSYEGLQLSDETIWPNSSVVLSPDRKQIVGYDHRGIAIIDLATRKQTSFKTDAAPHSLGWGGNDVIFYTSTESMRDLYNNLSEGEKQIFKNQVSSGMESQWPPELSHNQLSIHQLSLSDGSESVIYQTEAFSVGRLMPAPDGRELYFTTIPNMDEWLENTIKNATACNDYACIRPLFPPSVYRLDLVSGQFDLIGVGMYRATINFGANQ